MTTSSVQYVQQKLRPGLMLSRSLAWCWYFSRLLSRGVEREAAKDQADRLTNRYCRTVAQSPYQCSLKDNAGDPANA